MGHASGTADDHADVALDLAARRPEVVQRLLERGVPMRTLHTLFPGWEPVISEAEPPATG